MGNWFECDKIELEFGKHLQIAKKQILRMASDAKRFCRDLESLA
jgi:hypothetical protein